MNVQCAYIPKWNVGLLFCIINDWDQVDKFKIPQHVLLKEKGKGNLWYIFKPGSKKVHSDCVGEWLEDMPRGSSA